LWKEFRNYVRQAKNYDDAAIHIHGSSASLLHYYAALQLAKAELLITNPAGILGHALHHGLTYAPRSRATFASQAVTVRDGVFRLLYEKRTGTAIASGTRLPVKRLIASVPEIGYELIATGLVRPTVSGLIHTAVSNDAESWSLLALFSPAVVREGITSRLFLRHYKEVELPMTWRETFGITGGHMVGSVPAVFESRTKLAGALHVQLEACVRNVAQHLRGFLDESIDANQDATITPSLYRSRALPMPPSLARYAIMFYLSSLVRYRPSLLDRDSRASESWLFDAFTDQAPINLLRSSLSGIKRVSHRFLPSGALRR
jgi:hypothetical protein